uniref:Ribosomal protein L33 n=1 Tax=Cucumis melo TaxID=3656 RepID=A0A9I9EHA6_CUCME
MAKGKDVRVRVILECAHCLRKLFSRFNVWISR